ncbi:MULTISPECIES: hypothetical protein [unclassified Streptomyces]
MDQPRTMLAHLLSARGVAVVVTNHRVQIYVCPTSPEHPHTDLIQ